MQTRRQISTYFGILVCLGFLLSVFMFRYFLLEKHTKNKPDRYNVVVMENFGKYKTDKKLKIHNKTNGRHLKIMCLVFSSRKHFSSRIKAVNITWVQQCTHHMFIIGRDTNYTNVVQDALTYGYNVMYHPTVKDDYTSLWDKVRNTLIKINNSYLINEFDYYLKCDDDTYIIYNNLLNYLSQYDLSQPLYIGRVSFFQVKSGYLSGGAGYVMSKKSMIMLAQGFQTLESCASGATLKLPDEDVQMGKCMYALNITPIDAADNDGKELFNPADIGELVDQVSFYKKNPGAENYFPYNLHKGRIEVGPTCCSKTPISFHHMNERLMVALHYLLYHVDHRTFRNYHSST